MMVLGKFLLFSKRCELSVENSNIWIMFLSQNNLNDHERVCEGRVKMIIFPTLFPLQDFSNFETFPTPRTTDKLESTALIALVDK